MKRAIRVIALVTLLIMLSSVLVGCGGSSTASAGKCFWCDGVGYARYKDASGNYVNKTCSHCHGTGRQ